MLVSVVALKMSKKEAYFSLYVIFITLKTLCACIAYWKIGLKKFNGIINVKKTPELLSHPRPPLL